MNDNFLANKNENIISVLFEKKWSKKAEKAEIFFFFSGKCEKGN
jgi:hypothetical protein